MKVKRIIFGFFILFGNICALICCFYISYVSLIGTKMIEDEIFKLESQPRPSFSELLLFVGILIPVFCFLNCLILVVNSLLFFCLYGGVMIIFLILQTLIFLFLHSNVENIKTAFENKVIDLIENAGNSLALQSLQEKYNCCGLDAFTDWLKRYKEIPGSCCKKEFYETCPVDSVINVSGCRRNIHKHVEQMAMYLPYVFSIIFILEVILFATSVSVVISLEGTESLIQLPPVTNGTFDSVAEGAIHFEESVDTHS